ncbi:MAG: alanine--tRNA ligase [Bacteroidetes bacterium]|jgi:alanyl-tRNA synthetase|nr:alanine--tRNA ligase [Bacteroidota bacterium]
MDSNAVRQAFIDFFAAKAHKIVPSAPLVNNDDPSLLFINAGMNPFKDIFTGHRSVEAPRIANSQKCLRVSGKHNDLEEVGHDTYHHTLFEMLGNWSFGDYFRTEAIAWAWSFITEVLGIDPGRLYVTTFGGAEGVPADTAAAQEWAQYLPQDRILAFGKKDNFWEMGETGPCGPCTEIHVDMRPEADRARLAGASLVNQDHPQVIEIWNVVFMEYNRKADQSLEPLEMKSIDTGMGLERLCMVLQDKPSTYDTDIFAPLFAVLSQLCGKQYGGQGPQAEEVNVAMRVVVDHIRALAFTIADGQVPGNGGAGYVVRRLLRRAARYGYRFLGLNTPFQYQLVPALVAKMGDAFPELRTQQGFIEQVIRQEETAFLQTLAQGTQQFEHYLAQLPQGTRQLAGSFAFELYDTYGFPIDLTELMAREQGYQLDMPGFEAAMAEQKARSKRAGTQRAADWQTYLTAADPAFAGYDTLQLVARPVKSRVVETNKGKQYQLVLDQTPFYPESGGQVGDTGVLYSATQQLRVLNTVKENDLILHLVDQLPTDPAAQWTARVDADRRRRIRANHSATHLLHAALRRVLGTHVEQRGSLVHPDYLRFDFSHYQKLNPEELAQVEQLVNEQIAAQIPLQEYRSVPLAEAKAMGATALFGEKYGEQVRVIRFGADYSTELCGGTHVQNTVEIRLFKLTSEASSAAGIRRIEAVTGEGALAYVEARLQLLQQAEEQMGQPKDLIRAIAQLQDQAATLGRQVEQLRGKALLDQRARILAAIQPGKHGHFAALQVDAWSADELKQLAFELRKNSPNTAFVLGAIAQDKPLLGVMLSEGLEQQLDARDIIKAISPYIQGGGGGQPFFATAGGKNPAGLPQALEAARTLLAAQ